jgi:hypothetical protein
MSFTHSLVLVNCVVIIRFIRYKHRLPGPQTTTGTTLIIGLLTDNIILIRLTCICAIWQDVTYSLWSVYLGSEQTDGRRHTTQYVYAYHTNAWKRYHR